MAGLPVSEAVAAAGANEINHNSLLPGISCSMPSHQEQEVNGH